MKAGRDKTGEEGVIPSRSYREPNSHPFSSGCTGKARPSPKERAWARPFGGASRVVHGAGGSVLGPFGQNPGTVLETNRQANFPPRPLPRGCAWATTSNVM